MDYSNHGWVCSLPASKLNAIVNENFRDNIQSIKLTDQVEETNTKFILKENCLNKKVTQLIIQ